MGIRFCKLLLHRATSRDESGIIESLKMQGWEAFGGSLARPAVRMQGSLLLTPPDRCHGSDTRASFRSLRRGTWRKPLRLLHLLRGRATKVG